MICFFVCCLVPSVWTLLKAPALFGSFLISREKEGRLLGSDELVTADGFIRRALHGSSSDGQVIAGRSGWLYYGDTLDEYLGEEVLTDRELFNIAHSMALAQEYVRKQGAVFLYVPVPNKNTLYGEFMPYYYRMSRGYLDDDREPGNLERLYTALAREGVAYVNLYDFFENQDGIFYHRTDSHWNNQGAAYAAEQIQNALGYKYVSYAEEPYEIRADMTGDLMRMFLPSLSGQEQQIYYKRAHTFSYTKEPDSTFDPKIETVNTNISVKIGGKKLVMYRDSFGNALLPFLADKYAHAYFSRSVPYPIGTDLEKYQADTLIIERAERFLRDTACNPPVMEGRIRTKLPKEAAVIRQYEAAWPKEGAGSVVGSDGSAIWKKEGAYAVLEGTLLSEEVGEAGRIYVRINGQTIYEAFPITCMQEKKAEEQAEDDAREKSEGDTEKHTERDAGKHTGADTERDAEKDTNDGTEGNPYGYRLYLAKDGILENTKKVTLEILTVYAEGAD